MPGKNIHTVKSGDKWVNKKEGNKRASSTHQTQEDAAKKGADMARKEKSEHLIHGRNGRIRKRNSYTGKDPYPPRG